MQPDVDTPARSAFLDSLERRLDLRLRVDPDADDVRTERLIEAGRHLCLAGGKRARPRLVMLLGECLDVEPESLIDLATCVELIHVASLLHDDVVDEGQQRRGRSTANAVWGNLTAVLAGDLLLTVALGELRGHPASLHHAAVDTAAAMTRAALREAASRGRVDLPPDSWRTIARGKTAALFGLCGRGVGLLAGEPRSAERLARGCGCLGLAFQIADDLDDLLGRGAGKDPWADLRNQNPNYLVALAAAESPPFRRELAEAWSRGEVGRDAGRRLGESVLRTGAAEQAWRMAGQQIVAAQAAFEPWRAEEPMILVADWAQALWRRAEPGEEPCAAS